MSGARERIRRVTGSLYWRQFMLTAGMVLLTLALLGVSFYALSYNYTLSEKRQEMRDRAVLVAQLSVDYFTAGEDAEREVRVGRAELLVADRREVLTGRDVGAA